MLKIAVQKSERISVGFLKLLNKCGLKTDEGQSKLYCKFNELPIELYFVRGCDISALLAEKFDVAILGKDSFLETGLQNNSTIVKELGFAKCRLSFAGKNVVNANFGSENFGNKNLAGKVIATSYCSILKDYLASSNIDAKIVEMGVSVESAIELGLADFIFDIVQTGLTLLQHGLFECQKVLDLQAIMIAKKSFQSEILSQLLFRINAVLNGSGCKYLMFNLKRDLLNDVIKILPAGKSPTVLNLSDSNYCAIPSLLIMWKKMLKMLHWNRQGRAF